MHRGYVKLWRKSLDSKVFASDGLWRLWIYCLMGATFKKRVVSILTGTGTTEVELLPGQLIYGRHSFADVLGWKPSTVRNRMAKLKNMQKVDIQKDTHFSIISIINWDRYQPLENQEDRQEDTQRTGRGQAEDTYKKGNHYKPFKKDTTTPPKPPKQKKTNPDFKNYLLEKLRGEVFLKDFEKELLGFLQYRMSMPKKDQYQTPRGIDGLFRDLRNCRKANFDLGKCLAITQERNWRTPAVKYFNDMEDVKKHKKYDEQTVDDVMGDN